MKKVVIIEADTNDGDYITRNIELNNTRKCSGKFTEELIHKVCGALKDPRYRNWVTTEYISDNEQEPKEMYKNKLTQDEIEIFNGEVPFGEHGIHTIVSVRILEITSDEELLK
jgi:hypothetical protein